MSEIVYRLKICASDFAEVGWDMQAKLTADAAAEITNLRQAQGWQPMSTAPRGRWILLDTSYLYPGDTHPTENYVVGIGSDDHGVEYCWGTDHGIELHRDAPIGWMDIPKTLASPETIQEGER